MWTVSQDIPQVTTWDPQQGDLERQHGLYPFEVGGQMTAPAKGGNPAQFDYKDPATPQQLVAAGWTLCPRSGDFWISPENMEKIKQDNGYFTCPKCHLSSLMVEGLPWHGVKEPDYYPGGNTGGGTSIGLPMEDVGQIAENVITGLGQIPGYGPITWWHPGGSASKAPLDGTTKEWGIECKGAVYDSVGHFFKPGDYYEKMAKDRAARQLGLKGVLGVLVLLNFRNDLADVYVKEMPPIWYTKTGKEMRGTVKWHKGTGEKVLSGIPFESPYKDPNNLAPGPYSMQEYYNKPAPTNIQHFPQEPPSNSVEEEAPF